MKSPTYCFNKKWLVSFIFLWITSIIECKSQSSHEAPHLEKRIESLQKETMQPLARTSTQKSSFTETENYSNKRVLPSSLDNNHSRHLNQSAFYDAMQSAMPLSPDQITELKEQFYQRQAAITSLPHVPPKPVIASRYVNLAPGSVPMVLRLAQGYVSTLTFLDQTGQPWPIESYNIGDPQAFNVQWDKKSHLLMLQATTLYQTGNFVVKLKGLDVPVMLTLITGQKIVDYRLDLRMQGNGPHAKASLGRSVSSISSELLNILDGIPSENHKQLQVTGGEASAWRIENRLYLRTHLTVLSPAWLSTLSSPDGTKAYELPYAPFILVNDNNGKTIQLKVSEY